MNTDQNICSKLDAHLPNGKVDAETYRPRLFRLSSSNHCHQLTALLEKNEDIAVHDQLRSQLAALIETRHPKEEFAVGELEQLVDDHLDGTNIREYGLWVYYPWARRLVHILDKDEFVELRTSRNRYKITQEEQDLLSRKIVGVVGLSVGQSVALTMAIERSFGEIRLADFDTLELTNLNRLRSGLHNLGLSKVIIAAREIAEIDPFIRVRCFTEGISEENLERFLLDGGKLSLLIEECDGMDMKFLCRRKAREHRIPVVMDTSDRGMLDVERFDLEPDRPLFHGLVEEPSPERLKGLSSDEKVPYVLGILGCETLSTRLRASMLEVGNSIPTWPQLATSVALGGAVTGDACRRILLNSFHDSGRYYVDAEQLVGDQKKNPMGPDGTGSALHANAISETPRLTLQQMRQAGDQAQRSLLDVGTEPESKVIQQLVHASTLAPSGGNAQPWRWLYRNGRLWLFLDTGSSMSLDFAETGSHLALGAAAENLVLEAHKLGYEVTMTKFPLSSQPQLVAGFAFHPQGTNAEPSVSYEPHARDDLIDRITVRLTNRQLGPREPIDPEKLAPLVESANTFKGADLVLVDADDALAELGEIIASTDRLRVLHQQGHQDFVNEMRWTPEQAQRTRDGIDLATIDLTVAERAGLQLARDWSVVDRLRQWNGGKGFESLSRKSIAAASAVGLIRLRHTGPDCFFDGGRVVQRVWLEATRQQLAFQPVSGLLFLLARLKASEENRLTDGVALSPEMKAELPELRERFLSIFPNPVDQRDIFLFRLSLAAPPKIRSLRRPVEDVLTICDG